MSGKSLLTEEEPKGSQLLISEDELMGTETFAGAYYNHAKWLDERCQELAGKVGAFECILSMLRAEKRLKPFELEMFEKYETKDKPKIV